jgi:hypothetical protein
VLNSDRFTEQQMVELIIDAMVKAGYKLPAVVDRKHNSYA